MARTISTINRKRASTSPAVKPASVGSPSEAGGALAHRVTLLERRVAETEEAGCLTFDPIAGDTVQLWEKPAGARWVEIRAVGGGAGGNRASTLGSAAGTAAGTNRSGGHGGGGASHIVALVPAKYLPQTIGVVVGRGGAGATAPATVATTGGASTVYAGEERLLNATGGQVFGSTTTAVASTRLSRLAARVLLHGSVAALSQGNGTANAPTGAGGAGGPGGGVNSSNVALLAGETTGVYYASTAALGDVTKRLDRGAAGGGAGAHGPSVVDLAKPDDFLGGSGGGANASGPGGRGGDGGRGAGGGGGGAGTSPDGLDLSYTGPGGTGGDGYVIIRWW